MILNWKPQSIFQAEVEALNISIYEKDDVEDTTPRNQETRTFKEKASLKTHIHIRLYRLIHCES